MSKASPSVFHESTAAAVLCIAAGFADAVGFVQLGVFAANMTGNTVLLGLSLMKLDWVEVMQRALTLSCFFGGAAAGRVVLRAAGQQPVPGLLIEAALLGGAAFIDPKHAASLYLIAAAMGLQASTVLKFRGAAVSTVVITSTMARLSEWVTDTVMAHFGAKPAQPGTPPSLLFNTWVSYGVGAVLAAGLMSHLAVPLLLPSVLVLLVALVYMPRQRTATRLA